MPLALELRAAVRMWMRRPGLPTLAIVSMALAMAAATSVFTVTDAALWRPLPVPSPDRVVWITTLDRHIAGDTAPGVFTAWLSRSTTTEALGAIRAAEGTLNGDGVAERIAGAFVTSGVFRVLGTGAAAGRTLSEEDERAGAAAVLVISDRLWRTRFGAAPEIVGRTIDLDHQPRTIVGVMPPAFDAVPLGIDWLAPLTFSAAQSANVGPRYLDVIGRVAAAGVRPVESELTALAQSVGARGDTGLPLMIRVEPMRRHFAAEPSRVLLPLFGAVLAIVIIAAANVASLMMAHGQRRSGEIAIRASLGAGRGRLVRQLATEASLLAAVAGALSLVLAQWLTDALRSILPDSLQLVPLRGLDGRAVMFTLGVIGGVTLLVGLVPALRNARADLRPALATARGITIGNDRLRRGFVVAQIALAMSLGMAGLLMLQSVHALENAPRGYQADRVLTAAIRFPNADYPTGASISRAVDLLVASTAAASGVQRAAIATRLPLSGGAPSSDVALVSEPFSAGLDRQARIRFVTPGFFATVGTAMLEGRDLSWSDRPGAPRVVLVNDTLARRLSSGSVLGRALKFAVADFNEGGPATPWQIVGRVADARDGGPREPTEPEVYVSMAQGPADLFDWIGRRVLLAVQAAPGRTIAPAALRTTAAGAIAGLPLFDVQTLDHRFAAQLSTERLLSALLVPLGLTGAFLAAFGIYAVVTHLVLMQRRELAVRMVLGATPGAILRMTLGEGLALATAGIVLGALGSMLAGRSLRAVAFGVGPLDPTTLVAAGTLTLATIVVAVWWPARRASRLDPAVVLRDQ